MILRQLKLPFPKEAQFFVWLLLLYGFLFINLSNRLLLGFELLLVLGLFWRLRDIKTALWLTFLFFLPFEKGKGFVFELVPASFIPWDNPVSYHFTATFADVAFAALLLFLFREEIRSGWQRVKGRLRREDVFLFLFLGTGVISLAFSFYPAVSFLNFLKLSRMVAVFFVARQLLANRGIVENTVSLLAASLFFQGAWTTAQFLLRRPLGRSIEQFGTLFSSYGQTAVEEAGLFRPQGTFVHPNALASFLGVLIIFFAVLLLTKGRKQLKQYVLLPSLALGSLALVFSASRAAWIVVFGLLIFALGYLYRKKQLLLEAWLRGAVVRLSLILLVLIPFLILPRMISLYQAFGTYGSGYYRFDLISRSIDLVQRFPLGIGLGMFPAALVYEFPFEPFFGFPTPPHNIVSQIATEMGILGLVFFGLFLLYAYERFLASRPTSEVPSPSAHSGSALRQFPAHSRSVLGGAKELNLEVSVKTAAFFASLAFLGLASFYPLFLVPNLFDYFWLFLAIMLL